MLRNLVEFWMSLFFNIAKKLEFTFQVFMFIQMKIVMQRATIKWFGLIEIHRTPQPIRADIHSFKVHAEHLLR